MEFRRAETKIKPNRETVATTTTRITVNGGMSAILNDIKLPIDVSGLQTENLLTDSSSNQNSAPPLGDSSAGNPGLPSKPKSLEPWDVLKKEIDKTPNDITLWDKLFSILEDTFTKNFDSGEDATAFISPTFKAFAYDAYTELLTRFPYLTSYWKKFLIFEYKLNGVDASIQVLSKSVDSFPNSVSLWTDYLTALTGGDDGDSDHVEFVRSQFQKALKINGYHFLSHQIWDKLFEYEEKMGGDPFWLYLKVIKIPLYSYAKYYQKFTEINKAYTLAEFFDTEPEPYKGEVIQEYLTKFNKETLASFSTVETHQVIDDWSYKVFTATQAKVNAKWAYESLLTFLEFNLDSASLEGISSEYSNWVSYLNYEIDCLKQDDSSSQRKIITNLFERALIPNCLNFKLWLKYIAFLNKYESNDDEDLKFAKIDQLYHEAINRFVPLNDPKENPNIIRFNYIYFLKKYSKDTEARDYLISVTQMFFKENSRDEYLRGVEMLIELCDLDLKAIIEKYFQTENRLKLTSSDSSHKTEESPIQDVFYNLLSDDTIGLIVQKYLQANINDPILVRSFFNMYYQKDPMGSDLDFWLFYIKFEGITKHNIPNLLKLMRFIKENSKLPKQFVDAFIEIEYDIVSSNYELVLQLNNLKSGRTDNTIILKDNETSYSLAINQSWTKRLANLNFRVQDLSSKGKLNKEESFKKVLKSKVGHAGVVIDSSPEITNSLINSGRWIDLKSSRLDMPDFPTFKNVEKANVPIQYPK